jgi:hypothetical protein
MFCRCQPLPGDLLESFLAHACMGGNDDLCPVPLGEMRYGRHIVAEQRL